MYLEPADSLQRASDGSEVMRLAHTFHDDREVGLTAFQALFDCGQAFWCHAPKFNLLMTIQAHYL